MADFGVDSGPIGAGGSPLDFNDVPTGFSVAPIRDQIAADPSLSLSFKIETKKAQEQATTLDVKRHTDSAVMPLIFADIQKNQEHMDNLNQQIVDFTKKLAVPAPLHEIATLGPGSVLGVGLAALAGGQVSTAAGAGYKNEQAAADNTYANQMTQYGATREDNQKVLADLQRQMSEAQAHGEKLDAMKIGEVSQQEGETRQDAIHAADQQHGDIEKAKDRFLKATEEGDVRAAADDLAELHHPVSPEALDAAVKSAQLKNRKIDTAMAAQEYSAIQAQIRMYGGVSGAQADQLDGMVSAINAKYGTNYPPVIGGATWQKQNAADMLKYRQDNLKQHQDYLEKNLKIHDKQVVGELAKWRADREYQLGRLKVEGTRANADMVRAANSGGLQAAQKSLAAAQAQLDDVNKQIQALGPSSLGYGEKKAQTKALYSKRASIAEKVVGYKAAVNFIQHTANVDEGVSDSGTGATGDGGDPGAPDPAGSATHPAASGAGVTGDPNNDPELVKKAIDQIKDPHTKKRAIAAWETHTGRKWGP